MTRKEYNGWTNYETWLVKLWIDNEEGTQSYWLDAAREEQETSPLSAIRALSKAMRAHYEDAANDLIGTTGVFADLIGAALSEVNWDEIASAFIENVKQAA